MVWKNHIHIYSVFCIWQVISDVTGDEFETFIDMLAKLHHLSSSLEGIGQIVEIITDQAELRSDFQVLYNVHVKKFQFYC